MKETKKAYVDTWILAENNDKHRVKALENASRHFEEKDNLTVNTLEAIYGQESSFGTNFKNNRGSDAGAGHFQLEKKTAEQYNLIVKKDNDQRFDIDYSSDVAARYLKDLYNYFSKSTVLSSTIRTIPVKDTKERKKFALAAYNAGQGRIAQAQIEAEKAGENPALWDIAKEYLRQAGANEKKEKIIKEYVVSIEVYEQEFVLKSPADKEAKNKKPKPVKSSGEEGCHWVTLDQGPVCID